MYHSLVVRPVIVILRSILITVCLIGGSIASGPLPADPVPFDINRQPLRLALTEFARQSDRELLFSTEVVEDKVANHVDGTYEPEDALGLLLTDTGLDYSVTTHDTILVAKEDGGQDAGNSRTRPILMAQSQTSVKQNQTSQRTETKSDEDDKKRSLEEIIVTGTHIRGIAPDSTPSLSFGVEDIKATGLPTLNKFLRTIPQIFGGGNQEENRGPNTNGGGARGGASVNLRGFGEGRTLALLNGQRIAPSQSNFGPAVDISFIPIAALERVEIVTAGASSIYGSDAIGGVINFVLLDDFKGAETTLSAGTLTDGDGTVFNASQLLGTSWENGNAFVVYDYFSQDSLLAGDREFTDPEIATTELTPNVDRHTVFAVLRQDLGESLELFTNGYFSASDVSRDVNVAVEDAFYEEVSNRKTFGGTAGLRYEISENWQSEIYATHSLAESTLTRIDLPTGIVRSGSGGLLKSTSTIVGGKADGSLFSLPGGDVKIAIGGEGRFEEVTTTTPTSDRTLSSDVAAAFGELFVPLVGPSNARPGIERLEITTSARYEIFDGDLDSIDPQLGLVWAPTADLKLRGNWGTSFRIPTLEQRNPLPIRAFVVPIFIIPNPVSSTPATLLLQGTDPNLGSETSEFWTVGLDYSPQFASGLDVKLTYFNIDLTDEIDSPPLRFDMGDPSISEFVTLQPTDQQILDSLAASSGTTPTELDADLAGLGLAFSDIEAIYFLGRTNIARRVTRGFDITVDYRRDTTIGELGVNVSSSLITDFDVTPFSGADPISILSTLNEPVDWRLTGGLSWSRRGTNANLFVRYVNDYLNTHGSEDVKIEDFLTFDFAFSHDFGRNRDGALSGARVSLVVENLLDTAPPLVVNHGVNTFPGNGTGYDGANATARGRYVGLTVSKSW